MNTKANLQRGRKFLFVTRTAGVRSYKFCSDISPINKQGMANKRKRNKFYAVVTEKETNIYTSWEECQAATKGKHNVKYKGFIEKEQAEAYIMRHKNKRVSVTPEKGKESNETATPKTSSPTKEQAEARINQEQSPVSAEDTIETSDQQEEILKAIDESYVQRKYCLESCKYENGDESFDTMLTCDICDGWYHLTCTVKPANKNLQFFVLAWPGS